jgi:hypothetical protein
MWISENLSSTAGCIDTDLPAGRRNFGLSDRSLIETTNVHHAMWVMSTETCCEQGSDGRFGHLKEAVMGQNSLHGGL